MEKLLTEKGNVLVVGNSGVGKSTLINSVLGNYHAETGFGVRGTTKEIKSYENESLPFRLIDTAGFEPSKLKVSKLVRSIQKYSKERVKDVDSENYINAIWFCVDGTSAKLFKQTIEDFLNATSIWKTVPIIVVITKSYSLPDREKNINMVQLAFEQVKRNTRRPCRVIPVVAEPFYVTESAFASPYGITNLVEATNEVLPVGIQAAKQDVANVKLFQKRILAGSVVGASTIMGATIGAVPIPIPDSVPLATLEGGMIKGIASIYEIPQDNEFNAAANTILEMGTVGLVAKTALNALKKIPGLKIGASVLNAIVAGAVVLCIGQGSSYMFEQVYLGKKNLDDVDWIKQIMEGTVVTEVVDVINEIAGKLTETTEVADIKKLFFEILEQVLNNKPQKDEK